MIVKNGEDVNILANECSFTERERQLMEQNRREEHERKTAKNSNYSRWSQYNLEHSKEMILLASKHPKAHAILLFLLDNANDYNAVMCSYQVFQELLDVSRDTVRIALNVLKNHGLIHIYKSGTSNVYCINPDLYWKSYGNNVQYCKFPTNVIISWAEQDTEYKTTYENLKNITLKTDVKNNE